MLNALTLPHIVAQPEFSAPGTDDRSYRTFCGT